MRLLQNQQESMHLTLDALKYQYEIDHTHVYRWVRVVRLVEFACTWGHKSRKLSTNGDQKEDKSFCLIQISRSLRIMWL